MKQYWLLPQYDNFQVLKHFDTFHKISKMTAIHHIIFPNIYRFLVHKDFFLARVVLLEFSLIFIHYLVFCKFETNRERIEGIMRSLRSSLQIEVAFKLRVKKIADSKLYQQLASTKDLYND